MVFGATVSGRPADLPGVESMVGLFINTLPVRVQVDDGGRRPGWLAELQAAQAEAQAHEHIPLAEIQGWSERPRHAAVRQPPRLRELPRRRPTQRRPALGAAGSHHRRQRRRAAPTTR